MSKPIRVVIADDSPIVRRALERILSSDPDIDVAGVACDGEEAYRLVLESQPTVLCTDLHMPKMDGLALTRKLMTEHPLPIIVVSVSVLDEGGGNIFQLLDAGAIDALPKPRSGFATGTPESQELIDRIKLISTVRVTRKRQPVSSSVTNRPGEVGCGAIVAIGASTGGPQALQEIFSRLPGDFPLPIVCVQHISHGFLDSLVAWLDEHSPLHIAVAGEGEQLKPGHVYFPREHRHLTVNAHGRLENRLGDPEGGHLPSVNVMFRSLPEFYGSSILSIVLTGMGRDGADGMAMIADYGGKTIAQDEESCVVFGMPKAAIENGQVERVLPLVQIATAMEVFAGNYKRASTS